MRGVTDGVFLDTEWSMNVFDHHENPQPRGDQSGIYHPPTSAMIWQAVVDDYAKIEEALLSMPDEQFYKMIHRVAAKRVGADEPSE